MLPGAKTYIQIYVLSKTQELISIERRCLYKDINE